MGVYRGAGTSSSGTTLQTFVDEAEAARDAAQTAQASAEASETAAETAQTAAVSAWDSLDDRYLGAKAYDPAVDNDGYALITGALYWNSAYSEMRAYDGSGWAAVGASQILTYVYTATASQTIFTGADDNAATLSFTDYGIIGVYLNGVKLEDTTDYAASDGDTVTLTTGATAGDILEVVTVSAVTIANTYTQAQSDAKYALVAAPLAKNLVVNGYFDIWQRGSAASTNWADSTYGPDHWLMGIATSTVTWDRDRVASTASPYYLKLTCTTADATMGSTDRSQVITRIEGSDSAILEWGTANAKDITIKFAHAHSVTGTYCVNIKNSPTTYTYVGEYTQSSAGTWEEATITVPGPTVGTWVNTPGGLGIQIGFSQGCGSSYQASAAGDWESGNFVATSNQTNLCATVNNTFKLAQVRVFASSNGELDALRRTFGEELALCQRYFEKSYEIDGAPGTAALWPGTKARHASTTGTYIYQLMDRFAVEKAGTPTMTWYSVVTGTSGVIRNNTAGTDPSVTSTNLASTTGTGYPVIGTAPTVGDVLVSHWTAESEI